MWNLAVFLSQPHIRFRDPFFHTHYAGVISCCDVEYDGRDIRRDTNGDAGAQLTVFHLQSVSLRELDNKTGGTVLEC